MAMAPKPDAGGNGETGDAKLDPDTGSLRAISNEHAQIHASNAWEFSLKALAVALNGETLIEIRTGTKEVHLKKLKVWGDAAAAQFEFVEAPTIATPGTTAVPMPNKNRAHGAAAPTGVTMFSDPAVISSGTVLKDILFGGGAGVGQTAGAGEDTTDREWVLAKSTKYLIRVTNLEANARNFSIDGFFYLED